MSQEKDLENRKILESIIQDEQSHYQYLKNLTKKEVLSNRIKIWVYVILAKVLGLAFALKLMEQGERLSQKTYQALVQYDLEFARIFQQEQKHEELLLRMLKNSKLEYISSFVLGLNDALV